MNRGEVSILRRRLACENEKFHVYFDHVADQAGFEVEDYLVVSPKHQNQGMVTGVAMLPIVEGMIGLIRIYRPAIRDYSWEIPHGFAEQGESELISAMRELMEETGFVFKDAESMGYITPDSGVLAARVHMFVVRGEVESCGQVGELGLREFRLFEIDEFERMIAASEVQDSFTLSAWCQYQLRFGGSNGDVKGGGG